MRRRIKRVSARRRPLRRRSMRIGRSRIRRVRFGPRRLRRFRRGVRRSRRGSRSAIARVRRSSFSQRSTGNRGSTYHRRVVRLDSATTSNFPFTDVTTAFRRCVFCPVGALGASRTGYQSVTVSYSTGAITAPTEAATTGALTSVSGDLTAYLAITLADVLPYTVADYAPYSRYRIRSMRVTVVDRTAHPVYTANGVVTNAGYTSGLELALVNTSRIGEIAPQYGSGDTAGVVTYMDSVWGQFQSLRNRKNVSRQRRFVGGKGESLSISVRATERYQTISQNQGYTTAQGSLLPGGSTTPGQYANSTAIALANNQQLQIRNRPYRWTDTFLRYYNANGDVVTVVNDAKPAYGVQVIAKANTWTLSNPPSFTLQVSAVVEFCGVQPSLTTNTRPWSSQILFPFTSTMTGRQLGYVR